MARKPSEKNPRRTDSTVSHGASAFAVSATASRWAALGSDEMRAGMELFLHEVHRRANMKHPEQAEGFLFESIEAAKINANFANLGDTRRAYVRGDNHPLVDIEIKKGKIVEGKFQLKTGKNAAADLKGYPDEISKVTTKGDADPEHAIRDEVAHGRVGSGGTSRAELHFARKHPKLFAGLQEVKQVGREAAVAGGKGAVAGAIMGGATSLVRRGWAWQRGEMDGKEAAKEVGKDTARSSVYGGATAAGSTLVRHVGSKIGVSALKKANVAAAVASGLKDVSETVWAWAKGDISAEDAFIRLGDTGCGTLSGIYGGAAAGAIFGPVGAAAGSVVGYLLSACVYQSCVAAFHKAHLAEGEAERVVSLCAEAVRRMDDQRQQFERDASAWLKVREDTFDRHFDGIDVALIGHDPEKLTKSLSTFAFSFGRKLRHVDFREFQRFMDSEEPAVL